MFQINVNHASKDIDEHIEAGYVLNGWFIYRNSMKTTDPCEIFIVIIFWSKPLHLIEITITIKLQWSHGRFCKEYDYNIYHHVEHPPLLIKCGHWCLKESPLCLIYMIPLPYTVIKYRPWIVSMWINKSEITSQSHQVSFIPYSITIICISFARHFNRCQKSEI